ncbi:MAG: DUF3127 domain-containing protein [Bacteroidales bacterium]|nr:DUF3127 domain-containing protein [Bacteroidales bacterium]
MNLEIKGKLIKKLPEQTGEGKFGKWIKQDFVIETQDQYPKKICFSAWGDKTDILKKFSEGDNITVSFNPESREYNERWYTDLRAWKITGETEGNAPEDIPPPFSEEDIPPPEEEDIPF